MRRAQLPQSNVLKAPILRPGPILWAVFKPVRYKNTEIRHVNSVVPVEVGRHRATFKPVGDKIGQIIQINYAYRRHRGLIAPKETTSYYLAAAG